MERFNLNKLNEAKSKEKNNAEVSNRCAALKYFYTEVEINGA
jgi:hypothetical protein